MRPGGAAWRRAAFSAAALVLAWRAPAQGTDYRLDDERGWEEERRPEPGTDEAVVAEARAELAEGRASRAHALIDRWIRQKEREGSPWLPQAYLLRGDSLLALDQEWNALVDYETNIAQKHPESEVFPIALERQLGIGTLYLNGLKRRALGFRIEDATDDGVEALLRIQERMPGSDLAERAALVVMDYYYRTGQLELATTMSDIYLRNFPKGSRRVDAMELQIRANLLSYRGPAYDGSGLLDAREQVRRLMLLYPGEAQKRGMDSGTLAVIDENAAAQMLFAARWHEQRNDSAAARFTLRRLVRKHPHTRAAEQAMETLVRRGWVEAPAPAPEVPAGHPAPQPPPANAEEKPDAQVEGQPRKSAGGGATEPGP